MPRCRSAISPRRRLPNAPALQPEADAEPGFTWIARTRAVRSARPEYSSVRTSRSHAAAGRPIRARDARRRALLREREADGLGADAVARRTQALHEVISGRGVARRPGRPRAVVGRGDALQPFQVLAQRRVGGLRLRLRRRGAIGNCHRPSRRTRRAQRAPPVGASVHRAVMWPSCQRPVRSVSGCPRMRMQHAPHNAMEDPGEIARFHDRCGDLMRALLAELAAAPDRPRPFPEIEDAMGWPRRRIASVLGGVSRLRQTEFAGRRPYRLRDDRQAASGRWELWDGRGAGARRSRRTARGSAGHTQPVRPEAAHRSATAAGVITAPVGLTLLARPGLAAFTGLDPRTARAIGAADLVVAAGLLGARPRWPWAAARAAANLPTAAVLLRTGLACRPRRGGGARRADRGRRRRSRDAARVGSVAPAIGLRPRTGWGRRAARARRPSSPPRCGIGSAAS